MFIIPENSQIRIQQSLTKDSHRPTLAKKDPPNTLCSQTFELQFKHSNIHKLGKKKPKIAENQMKNSHLKTINSPTLLKFCTHQYTKKEILATERKPKINKYRYIMTDRRYHQSLEECTAKSSKGHS